MSRSRHPVRLGLVPCLALCLASCLVLGALPAAVQAQKHDHAGHRHAATAAHQHGLARLEVVADGGQLSITLDSPLDNLLGFERAPRTERERQAARAVAQRLRAPADLLQPTPAAGCVLREVALQSDVVDPALLAAAGTAPAAAPPAPTPGDHADLEARWVYQCSQPAALKGVAMGGLFKAFGRLRQIEAAVVAPGVQRGAKLQPQRADLGW